MKNTKWTRLIAAWAEKRFHETLFRFKCIAVYNEWVRYSGLTFFPIIAMKRRLFFAGLICFLALGFSTAGAQQDNFSKQDRLRGSITPERGWWDLQHYSLSVNVSPETKSIRGANIIRFKVVERSGRMQIDLQEPLKITKIFHQSESTKGDSYPELSFEREGNVYWVECPTDLEPGSIHSIRVDYQGVPVESENPPWSGGLTWQQDEKGNLE